MDDNKKYIAVKDVLGWLLAYHTKSFDLKGRYLPYEVISWLIHDISTTLLGEDEWDG
jgi:hypothetical protein